MEINIIEETENKLLNRKEIHFECSYLGEATPPILDVKNKLVAQLDVDKTLLVVDKLKPSFGEGKAKGYAKIYESEEDLNTIEPEHVLNKNKTPTKKEEEE